MSVLNLSLMPTFKCVLLGDSGTGKTSFIKRICNGVYATEYNSTLDVMIYLVIFATTRGKVCFQVWDFAGRPRDFGRGEYRFLQASCSIIMCDQTACSSFKNVTNWRRSLYDVVNNIPVAVCANKKDSADKRLLTSNATSIYRKKGLEYFEISVAQNENLLLPFLYFSRKLLYDSKLEFVAIKKESDVSISIEADEAAEKLVRLTNLAAPSEEEFLSLVLDAHDSHNTTLPMEITEV